MEAAVRARKAGRQAVRDVSPDPLRERIDALLGESAMVPGVLALASAHAVEGAGPTSVAPEASDDERTNGATPAGATTESVGGDAGRTGSDTGPVGVEERAAGVQLIYEGLRLTRALADDPPWERDLPHTDSNIDILAADVMVARGFSLLARTEAADKAVETVQSFGRDETDEQQGRAVSTRALETDVFELAVVAGTTAFGATPSDALVAYAGELAESLDGDSPEPPESVSEAVEEAVADAPNPRQFGPAEDPQPSATDP
ncbi:hypothetical protein M0R88_04630 [Halorussus gelatinilyticus]|uniref:Uncharacterized protein n=1 Tax=Halorussus gelatinilyticus TaxID=2937524 RepID=A0A8U0IJU4_9EURY|nr:hypothetical protein [Halorussus gelatinilyticus]UPW01390.1 hypothetical protein M0R88_04630 [Halorussus gelatinilyticus]